MDKTDLGDILLLIIVFLVALFFIIGGWGWLTQLI